MKKLIVACFILNFLTLAKPAHSAMGDLDSSFGNSGVFTSSTSQLLYPRSLSIDSTGEIYMAGETGVTSYFSFLTRISSNGLSESILMNDLIRNDLIGSGAGSSFYSVLVKNGKIFAGGISPGQFANEAIIAAFNPDGSLDTSFGDGDGIAQEVSSGSQINSYGRALAIDAADNFILAGGIRVGLTSGNTKFQVLRFTPQGLLDTSFGGGFGYVLEDFGSITDTDMANAVAIDADGNIIVAGTTGNKIGIVRYKANGDLDTTFSPGGTDGDGRIISSLSTLGTEVANSVAITSTGKIIVAGYIYEEIGMSFDPIKSLVLLQYNSNGSPDTDFGGGDGVVTTSVGAQRTVANAMVLDNNNRIVVAGYYYENSGISTDTVLLRYNADGSVDNTFSDDGQVFSNLDTVNVSDQNYSLAIDSQNNILVASTNNTTHISRYIGSPVCGDSLVEGSEECDLGDTIDHDECSSTCLNETSYYIDADGDGYGSETKYYSVTHPGAGYSTLSTDCDDTNALASPAGTEVCDGADNDCDLTIDDNAIDSITYSTDADGDGYGAGTTTTGCSLPAGSAIADGDCDDGNANINPGKAEICGNGIDENCSDIDDDNTGALYYTDGDNDGYGDSNNSGSGCTIPAGSVGNKADCNDNNAAINTSASEVCDGVDNDCDGAIDELASCTDADSDGVFADTDCNDNDPGLGAERNYYVDADGDKFGENGDAIIVCKEVTEYSLNNTDCNDADANINTSASEVCDDSVDNNCDGVVDEECDTSTTGDTTSGGTTGDTTGGSTTGDSTTGDSTTGDTDTTGSKNESNGSGGSSSGCQLVKTSSTNTQTNLLIFALMALLPMARLRKARS